jgi:hypothetical protein
MSGTSGKSEGLTSLKKESKDSYSPYRFPWLKRLVDKLFSR